MFLNYHNVIASTVLQTDSRWHHQTLFTVWEIILETCNLQFNEAQSSDICSRLVMHTVSRELIREDKPKSQLSILYQFNWCKQRSAEHFNYQTLASWCGQHPDFQCWLLSVQQRIIHDAAGPDSLVSWSVLSSSCESVQKMIDFPPVPVSLAPQIHYESDDLQLVGPLWLSASTVLQLAQLHKAVLHHYNTLFLHIIITQLYYCKAIEKKPHYGPRPSIRLSVCLPICSSHMGAW